ncbi:hypothetical protein NDA16_003275 [Ustilago loliicola]|nr:hypothetical protein NDA16_003275 [Ustilago loliicola]
MPSKIALSISALAVAIGMVNAAPHFEYKSYNGGHNVASSSENKLIDVSDLTALVNVLSKRHDPSVEYYNGGHNVESTNENKLIDLSDLTALVNVLSKRSLKGYGSKIHARDISETLYRRTNDDEDCTCVKKPKPTPPKQNPTQPPRGNNGGNGGNGGDCSADKPTPPPTDNKPSPSPKVTCGTNEVYIDEGHNVVSHNENKLLDLSNIKINIDILGDLLGGKKEQKAVTADSVCTAKSGCCVAKSVYYYNGGHNIESSNENKGLDLSGLNLGLNIL